MISPYFVSEAMAALRDPVHGYTLCRLASIWNATGVASFGESAHAPNGKPKTNQQRQRDLLRAWDKVGRGRDGYNQGHVIEAHKAMFPGMPLPKLGTTRDFQKDVWADIGSSPSFGNHCVSLSVDLSALGPAAELRKYTNPVNHQIVIYARRVFNGVEQGKVLDPMHPPSDDWTGFWVPRSEIAKAAGAIESGLIIFESYPVNGWTQERLTKERLRSVIKDNVAEIVTLTAEKKAFRIENVELEQELKDCTETSFPPPGPVLPTRDEVLDEVIVAVEKLRAVA